MCRWILKTVSTDNLPGRRRRLVDVIWKRKFTFLKTNVCCTKHLSFVSVKAKWEPKLTQNVHIHSHTHALPVQFLLKKNTISHSSSSLPLSENYHGGVKQLQRKRVRKTLQRLIRQPGSENCNLSFSISATLLALSFEVLSEALNHG